MAERIARVTRWLVPFTLTATFGALAWWWFTSPAEVTLIADRREVSVSSRDSTVGELLRRRGIVVDEHDRVSPPLEASLRDGIEVRVVRARPVVVEMNGVFRTVWSSARTVDELVGELGLGEATVEPARDDPIPTSGPVVLLSARTVRVVADGERTDVLTSARTVGELVDDLGIDVDGDDEIEPGADAPVEEGLAVRVTRVEREVTVEDRPLGFQTIRRDDPSRPHGQVRVIQEGVAGLERVQYRLVLRDGAVVERTIASRTVVREPRSRIVAVGTKSTDRQSGHASWYSGGAMICAHRTLPFGTNLTVVNLGNGRSVVCRVADRGPFVSGRVVDLSYQAFRQLADPSVGIISVRISW
jgi:uncharacterized protein YabE (DUF348 family)